MDKILLYLTGKDREQALGGFVWDDYDMAEQWGYEYYGDDCKVYSVYATLDLESLEEVD